MTPNQLIVAVAVLISAILVATLVARLVARAVDRGVLDIRIQVDTRPERPPGHDPYASGVFRAPDGLGDPTAASTAPGAPTRFLEPPPAPSPTAETMDLSELPIEVGDE